VCKNIKTKIHPYAGIGKLLMKKRAITPRWVLKFSSRVAG